MVKKFTKTVNQVLTPLSLVKAPISIVKSTNAMFFPIIDESLIVFMLGINYSKDFVIYVFTLVIFVVK